MMGAGRLPRPTTGEAPFGTEEIFFSRTDARGVILSGNEVFKRVADHDWDRLIGAPHKVIRHPDMPRAAFWLLWHEIGAGRPVGAYVKNLARDGLFYWVFAILMPVEGGYLSVRIRPTSPLKKVVEREYAALCDRETAGKLTPEASAALLLDRIAELGFPSYQAFMAHALAEEVIARSQAMERETDPRIEKFRQMAVAIGVVQDETRELSRTFAEIRGIPHNMRILATRLEAAGGPIGVISANYGTLSHEIGTWVQNFITDSDSAFESIRKAIDSGLFLQCAAGLQAETLDQFAGETLGTDLVDVPAESRRLKQHTEECQRMALDGLHRIMAQSERFTIAVKDMRRQITGLSTTRMMCKIESARLPGEGDSLAEIIKQLDRFQTAIEERLGRIDEQNRAIQAAAGTLVTKLRGKTGDRRAARPGSPGASHGAADRSRPSARRDNVGTP